MSAPEIDPFDAIVGNLTATDWSLCKTLPMNGVEVIVDAELGEQMRQAVLEVSSRAMEKLVVTGGSLSEKQMTHVDKVLYKHFNKGKIPVNAKDLIAVSGVGAYLTYSWEEGDLDINIDVLTPTETLFGYFEDINYNSYPYVEGLPDLPVDYEDVIEVDDGEGLIMALGSVMLCDTEGYGQQHAWYEHAVVPLEVPGLIIQKVFPR